MSDNKFVSTALEETIYDIKYMGILLGRCDTNQELHPDVICGIGDLITKTAERALDELRQGGAS